MTDPSHLTLAYIGGGSRGWARNIMNDLGQEASLSGEVRLYDIDRAAAEKNAVIGNAITAMPEAAGKWTYRAADTLCEALTGADFVLISILPGTFDEMRSDVHAPEKYGIYQSVGDSTGPGGIVRAMRTIPMFETFARAVQSCCPGAWVINFTNPMTACVAALHRVFPGIKAFGCCHEVFGTQKILAKAAAEAFGVTPERDEIVVNVLGVNHFTWITEAKYRGRDLLPVCADYLARTGDKAADEGNWAGVFASRERVKYDLFLRCGALAAAGDRHLAEFCPGRWYLASLEKAAEFGFSLTGVDYRVAEYERLKKETDELVASRRFSFYRTGEETVRQIKALLGLGDFVTNVNLPNAGQMTDAPAGAVVETNAFFSGDSVRPLVSGSLPPAAAALVRRVVAVQELTISGTLSGDYETVFSAFVSDPNVCLPLDRARALFDEMLYNTKAYLPHYDAYRKGREGRKNTLGGGHDHR